MPFTCIDCQLPKNKINNSCRKNSPQTSISVDSTCQFALHAETNLPRVAAAKSRRIRASQRRNADLPIARRTKSCSHVEIINSSHLCACINVTYLSANHAKCGPMNACDSKQANFIELNEIRTSRVAHSPPCYRKLSPRAVMR